MPGEGNNTGTVGSLLSGTEATGKNEEWKIQNGSEANNEVIMVKWVYVSGVFEPYQEKKIN